MSIPYWRLSGFYFFYFITLGSFLPYWSLYLQQQGFNALEIGQLSALMMATKIISPNLWGWIADRSRKSLQIIRLASWMAALLFAGFLFKGGYAWFALITVGFSFFWNAALPQFEAVTLFHLRAQAHRYSHVRLWGSIGFIVGVLGIGWLLDQYEIALLPQIITAQFVVIWLTTLMTPEVKINWPEQQAIKLWQILKKPEIIAFFMVYLLLQAAHGPYYVFYSVYLKQLDYPASVIGRLWAIGVCAEVLLLLYMKKLLTLVSLRKILLFSILFSVLRWTIIACKAQSLYWINAAQLLHAATFGSSHVVAIHLVHDYFGQQHQGKGQALYSSISFGLGGMLGSLFSGYYWEKLAATGVYSSAAACCILAFAIAYRWVGRKHW